MEINWPLRILVTGDRHWECLELARSVVRRLAAKYGRRDIVIVHSGAEGVDTCFEVAAGMIAGFHPAFQMHSTGRTRSIDASSRSSS